MPTLRNRVLCFVLPAVLGCGQTSTEPFGHPSGGSGSGTGSVGSSSGAAHGGGASATGGTGGSGASGGAAGATGGSQCVPTTCSAANAECGTIPDGCSGTIDC